MPWHITSWFYSNYYPRHLYVTLSDFLGFATLAIPTLFARAQFIERFGWKYWPICRPRGCHYGESVSLGSRIALTGD